MKRTLEILRVVFCVLGIVALAAAYSMGPIFGSLEVFTVGAAVFLPVILGLGAVLYLTSKDTPNRVGAGLIVACIIASSAITFAGFKSGMKTDVLICLIADGFFLLSFAVAFIKYCVCKEDSATGMPEEDPRIKKVLAWKKLQEEGIISAEEFEEKRLEILEIKSKK